jgi:RNA polymerase sigma-70 factor (ECF subfamily)
MTAPPPVARGWVEEYRAFLAVLGRVTADRRLLGKLDLSGVVQQTMLDACRAAGPPDDPDERLAWVRQIFLHNLGDEVRMLRAACRDVGREVPGGNDADTLLATVPAGLSTPSRMASRAEELLRLTAALETLPENQRTAVELRYLLGLGVEEVAERLGTTRPGAAGLLRRGLEALRERLGVGGPPAEGS